MPTIQQLQAKKLFLLDHFKKFIASRRWPVSRLIDQLKAMTQLDVLVVYANTIEKLQCLQELLSSVVPDEPEITVLSSDKLVEISRVSNEMVTAFKVEGVDAAIKRELSELGEDLIGAKEELDEAKNDSFTEASDDKKYNNDLAAAKKACGEKIAEIRKRLPAFIKKFIEAFERAQADVHKQLVKIETVFLDVSADVGTRNLLQAERLSIGTCSSLGITDDEIKLAINSVRAPIKVDDSVERWEVFKKCVIEFFVSVPMEVKDIVEKLDTDESKIKFLELLISLNKKLDETNQKKLCNSLCVCLDFCDTGTTALEVNLINPMLVLLTDWQIFYSILLSAVKKYQGQRIESATSTGGAVARLATPCGGAEGKLRAERIHQELSAMTLSDPVTTEQQKQLVIIAAGVIDPGRIGEYAKTLKDFILKETINSGQIPEHGLSALKRYLSIKPKEIADKRNEWEASGTLTDHLDQLRKYRQKIFDLIGNDAKKRQPASGYLSTHTEDSEGRTRALHLKDALENISEADPELQRKLYRVIYLLTLHAGTFSHKLMDSVLAASELTKAGLEQAIKENVKSFGDIAQLTVEDAKFLFEADVPFEANLFPENEIAKLTRILLADAHATTEGPENYAEKLAQSFQEAVSSYKSKKSFLIGLGRARADNVLKEIEAIANGTSNQEKIKKLLTLKCAVVFKTSSKELKKWMLELDIRDHNDDDALNERKLALKQQQLAAGISNYAIWEKAREIDALKVPDWRAFKQQVLDAINAYVRFSNDHSDNTSLALCAEEQIRLLPAKKTPGAHAPLMSLLEESSNFFHNDQYQLLFIVKGMMLQHQIPTLRESLLAFISESGLNESDFENLAKQYGLVDSADDYKIRDSLILEVSKPSYNLNQLIKKIKQIKLVSEIELLLMGGHLSEEEKKAAVDLLSQLPNVEHELNIDYYRRYTELKKIIERLFGDENDQDLLMQEFPTEEVDSKNAVDGNSENGEGSDARSALFNAFKKNLLRAVDSYIRAGEGHDAGKLRAKNFKAALAAIPQEMSEKDHQHLVLLAAAVSTGSGSMTALGNPTKFHTKVLIFTGMTTEKMDQLRKNMGISDLIRDEIAAQLETNKNGVSFNSGIGNWADFKNALEKAVTAYDATSIVGITRKTRILEALEKIPVGAMDTNEAQCELVLLVCAIVLLDSANLKDSVCKVLAPPSGDDWAKKVDAMKNEMMIVDSQVVVRRDELNRLVKDRSQQVVSSVGHAAAAAQSGFFPVDPGAQAQTDFPPGGWIAFRNKVLEAVRPQLPQTASDIEKTVQENLISVLSNETDNKRFAVFVCAVVNEKSYAILSAQIKSNFTNSDALFAQLMVSQGIRTRDYLPVREILVDRSEREITIKGK